MARRSTNPREFLTPEETAEVEAAVGAAEGRSSGEVRVVIVRHCWRSIAAKARRVFHAFGMERTARRNGVLVLLVTANRQFAIYGDRGIHEQVGPSFWEEVCDDMAHAFAEDRFGPGLSAGIRRIGEKLALHFPHQKDDTNALPDGIGYEQ